MPVSQPVKQPSDNECQYADRKRNDKNNIQLIHKKPSFQVLIIPSQHFIAFLEMQREKTLPGDSSR